MSEQSDELTMWEVAGLLRLPVRMARRWVRSKVPKEAVRHEGRHVYVRTWGIHKGLDSSRWQPKPRKGYQYRPGRRPINADCRDAKGRFVSHRTDRRPPRRKGFIHPARRRYLSDAD